MGRQTIQITNGKGSIELVNGTYKATAIVGGYDASTLEPKNVTIVEGTDTYAFTISAKGVLTLHVTDTGDSSTGVQVVGAKFIRTDSTGAVQVAEAITDQDGNAKFENVPYSSTENIEIYYKQVSSDGGHTFDDTLKSITMKEATKTIEVKNPPAPLRNFTLTDASFPNIVIKDGQIILEES